jgi:branched-chain amino acid transport system permease protein
MNLLLQLFANGLINGALYALLAVGFGIVWRSLRVFHVMFGGSFVLSGYCFYTLVRRLELDLVSASVLTVAFAALLGWMFEVGLYRPFARKQASSGSVFIASLGVYLATENLVALVFGNEVQTILRGTARTLHVGSIVLTEIQVLQFVIGYATVILLGLLVRRSRTFAALWAMGDQPELIPVLGLPVNALRATAVVSSTILAAIASILVVLDVGTDPHIGMSYLLIAGVAVLAGGANSYAGWISGAVALAMLQSLVVWVASARWMDLLTFTLLVAILVFRPHGLIDPSRRVEEQA